MQDSATRVIVLALFPLIAPLGALQARSISIPADLPTIQEALHAVEDGDTISVAAGEYFRLALTVARTSPGRTAGTSAPRRSAARAPGSSGRGPPGPTPPSRPYAPGC